MYSDLIMENKIVLLGYMGSGKSTIGQLLADDLNMPFIDLDHHIESQLAMTISEIFEEKGEIYFRKQENHFLKELLESEEGAIIALGGGTPVYSRNMELVLSSTPNVFYLKLGISVLVERLKSEKEHRPLISHLSDEELPEFIGKHLFERNPFYNQANHIIAIDGLIPGEVVELVKEKLV